MPLLTLLHGGGSGPPNPPALAHRTVSAELLDYDGTPVAGDPLLTAFGISWYDEEDGPGRGQVSLALSEAGSAELLPGRYVNCIVSNGVTDDVRFTFRIEGNPRYSQIDQGEEKMQIVSVQGRGWTSILDDAQVFPEYDLKFQLQTTWRLFSFASALFPNAGDWDPAVEQAEYLDGVTEAACYGHWQEAPDSLAYPAPIGWPWGTNPNNLVAGVPTANYEEQFWIRTADQPSYVSTGYYFFRNEFTLSADLTLVKFTCTGDNYFTLFLEGVPILGEKQSPNADHLMWQGWKETSIYLSPGTYTVAAVVYNVSFADLGAGSPVYQPPCPAEGWAGGDRYDNPGGLLAAIYIDGNSVDLPVAILMSNDTWTSHYDATTWPGWTPGQMISQLLSEAVARGTLTVLGADTWTDDDDSNGDPWLPFNTDSDRADMPTFAAEVGSSIMQTLQKAYEEGWIRWHGQPGTFELDVWRGRLPTSPVASATLTAGEGGTLTSLERNATAPYANALLVQWTSGYKVVEDLTEIADYGTRVEAMYASDAPTEEEAQRQGENELARRAQSRYPSIVATVDPRTTVTCPYEAFGIGDYVTVPAVGGGTETVRVLSISCTQDPLGYASWALELNQKLDVPERRTSELLQQIGGRNQIVKGSVKGS